MSCEIKMTSTIPWTWLPTQLPPREGLALGRWGHELIGLKDHSDCGSREGWYVEPCWSFSRFSRSNPRQEKIWPLDIEAIHDWAQRSIWFRLSRRLKRWRIWAVIEAQEIKIFQPPWEEDDEAMSQHVRNLIGQVKEDLPLFPQRSTLPSSFTEKTFRRIYLYGTQWLLTPFVYRFILQPVLRVRDHSSWGLRKPYPEIRQFLDEKESKDIVGHEWTTSPTN